MESSFKLMRELKKIKLIFNIFVALNIFHVFEIHLMKVSVLLGDLIQASVLGIFLYLFNKTFKKLNYSFWTFSLIFLIYYLFQIVGYIGTYKIYNLVLIGLLFISICYAISSPLYYPRVRWWEYDFRYKGDLKVNVELGGKEQEGRLFDLRRKAGCLTLFDHLKIGDQPTVKLHFAGLDYQFKVEVITAKSNTIGRGYIHGVRFLLTDVNEENRYFDLAKKWKILVKQKIKDKFNEGN